MSFDGPYRFSKNKEDEYNTKTETPEKNLEVNTKKKVCE